MIFRLNNKPPLVQPASQEINFQLDAAVLVCDTFLIFKNDAAVYYWAAEIMKDFNSAFQLAQMAKVEAVVGYKGDKHDMYTNMHDLLNLTLARMGLPPNKYVVKFFELEVQVPHMWIWGVVAVRPNQPKHMLIRLRNWMKSATVN